jgi:CrcB protein
MLKNILLVGLGGAVGSILRYLIGFFIKKQFPIDYQTFATFIVNFFGSIIIGYGMSQVMKGHWHDNLIFLIIIGFCGGFTTFSTFSYENFVYLQNQQFFYFLSYTCSFKFLAQFIWF